MTKLPNENKLWMVLISIGNKDNNMYVRADSKKEAIEIARKYVEVMDINPIYENEKAIKLIDNEDEMEFFLEHLIVNDKAAQLVDGVIDGYCFQSN